MFCLCHYCVNYNYRKNKYGTNQKIETGNIFRLRLSYFDFYLCNDPLLITITIFLGIVQLIQRGFWDFIDNRIWSKIWRNEWMSRRALKLNNGNNNDSDDCCESLLWNLILHRVCWIELVFNKDLFKNDVYCIH